MTVKLAILKALASRPERDLSIDEIRLAVRETIAELAQSKEARRLASLGDVDIFASRFVMRGGHGIYITDEGIDLLHWLTNPQAVPPPVVITTPASLSAIDAAIGAEARMEIFDLDFRASTHDERDAGIDAADSGNLPADPSPHVSAIEARVADARAPAHPAIAEERGGPSRVGRVAAKAVETGSALLSTTGTYLRRFVPARRRLVQGAGGAAVALLGAMVLIACIVTVISYGQIRSLQSEVVAIRRELAPAKERIARLEQLEKSRRDQEAPDKPSTLKERLSGVDRSAEAPLLLSREEIQLIRDYIKPAPSAGSTLPPVGIGDPVAGPTFPVPSAVTDKVPRLIGAMFTIRSGSIVIIRKDSRHADAVLGQN